MNAKEEAQKEIEIEQLEIAKDRYKKILKSLSASKRVTINLERELEDLELELSQE